MQQVGTPAFAAQYSGHPFFGVDLGKVRFRRNDVLEEAKLKGYFSKGAKLKGMLERAQKKGQVERRTRAPAAATAKPTQTAWRARRSGGRRRVAVLGAAVLGVAVLGVAVRGAAARGAAAPGMAAEGAAQRAAAAVAPRWWQRRR